MPPTVDLDSLSQDQRSSLEQYTAVTNQDIEAAIPVLQRAEWNVQVRPPSVSCHLLTLQIAISRFFDGEPEPDPVAEALNIPPADTRRQEVLASGFSSSSPSRPARFAAAPRIVPPPNQDVAIRPFFPLSLIFTLFNFVSGLAGGVFRAVFLRLPILPALLARLQARARSASARRPLGNPRDTAARFVREFQEEYGANRLPWLEAGYAHALDRAKRELKYLLVVLLSPENDETAGYVRVALLAPETAAFLNDPQNDVLLWGGSVHDAEAYQVAAAFDVTKLPYTALIARCPSDSSSSSSSSRAASPFGASSSGMNILLAISGTPDAPSPSTSSDDSPPSAMAHPAAAALLSRIRAATRAHAPHLRALRGAAAERDAARALRDEQDAAYERSLARDRERARQKREREARERRRHERTAKRDEWRRWRAARLAASEPSEAAVAAAQEKGAPVVRVSIRMPGGERVVRRFEAGVPVEEVYALVECWPLLSDATLSPSKEARRPEGYEHANAFRLVSPIPRVVLDVEDAGSIGERIGRSANLIVETAADDEEDDEE
jgi:FAS-associated factor 2